MVFRTRRERFLGLIMFVSALVLGGSYAGRELYQTWTGMDQEIEDQRLYLSRLQAIAKRKAGIEQEYLKTKSELTMNSTDYSAQIAQFSSELQALLRNAGVEYRELQQQDRPIYEEDFKVLQIDINQAHATPARLGTFLYNLENRSNVMYVEELTLVNETAGRSRMRLGGLTVDMRIARLVEYATGETRPETRRGRLRPRR